MYKRSRAYTMADNYSILVIFYAQSLVSCGFLIGSLKNRLAFSTRVSLRNVLKIAPKISNLEERSITDMVADECEGRTSGVMLRSSAKKRKSEGVVQFNLFRERLKFNINYDNQAKFPRT